MFGLCSLGKVNATTASFDMSANIANANTITISPITAHTFVGSSSISFSNNSVSAPLLIQCDDGPDIDVAKDLISLNIRMEVLGEVMSDILEKLGGEVDLEQRVQQKLMLRKLAGK